MMRRGVLLFVGAGLLGLLAGCHHQCQGRCDCLVHPIEHGTPCPFTKTASVPTTAAPPLAPVSAHE
jgi:hypothetical protein